MKILLSLLLLMSSFMVTALADDSGIINKSKTIAEENIDYLFNQFDHLHTAKNEYHAELVLSKMKKIAPEHKNTLAIIALISAEHAEVNQTNELLFKLSQVASDHPWLKKIKTILRLHTTDKAALVQAKMLARGGQFENALSLMNELFDGEPPTAALELLYWEIASKFEANKKLVLNGFKSLTIKYPDHDIFQLAYLKYQVSLGEINNKLIEQVIILSKNPKVSIDANQVWKNAILKLKSHQSNKILIDEYLAYHPDDSVVLDKYNILVAKIDFENHYKNNTNYQFKIKGLQQLKTGNNQAAKKYLKRSLREFSEDIEIVEGLGFSSLRLGHHNDAQHYFKNAAKLDPSSKTYWLGLAETARYWGAMRKINSAIDVNDFRRAENLIKTIIDYEKEKKTTRLKQIQLVEAKGNISKAINMYFILLKNQPDFTEAHQKFLLLLSEKEQIKSFNQYLKSLSEEQKTLLYTDIKQAKSHLYFIRAQNAIAEKKLLLATEYWKIAIMNSPNNFELIEWAEANLFNNEFHSSLKLFGDFIKKNPNSSKAHLRIIQLLISENKHKALITYIDRLQKKIARSQSEQINSLLGNHYIKRAEQAKFENKLEQAITEYKMAHSYRSDDPWLTLDLARTYKANKQPEEGEIIFQKLIMRMKSNSEVLYANAIFLNSLDKQQAAYNLLIQNDNDLSDNALVLKNELKINLFLQELQQESKEQQITRLNQIDLKSLTPEQQLSIAIQWTIIDKNKQAEIIFDNLNSPNNLDDFNFWQKYTQTLQSAQMWSRSRDQLNRNIISSQLSRQEKVKLLALYLLQLQELSLEYDDLLHKQGLMLAQSFVAEHPKDIQLLELQVGLLNNHIKELSNEQHQYLISYEKTLEILPVNISISEVYLRFLDGLNLNQKLVIFVTQLPNFEKAKVNERASLVSLLIELSSDDKNFIVTADRILQFGLKSEPDNARLVILEAELADITGKDNVIALRKKAIAAHRLLIYPKLVDNSLYAEMNLSQDSENREPIDDFEYSISNNPLDDWKVKKLQALLINDSSKNNGHIITAIDWLHQPGASGKSEYTAITIPIEVKLPFYNDGHFFARVEPVFVNAGIFDTSDKDNSRTFGALLLCQPFCEEKLIEQKQQGYTLALGLQKEKWKADIGTTPLGFAIEDLVGGFTYKGDISSAYWSAEISRRAHDSTLLSYAGTFEPFLGKVWGGVRKTGVTLGLGYDQGEEYGLWSNFGYHIFDGKNTVTNQRITAMGGVYLRLLQEDPFRLTVGLNLLSWSYDNDYGEFTFGQGGYYSPELYISSSIPIDLYGRIQDFSYKLSLYPAYSWSEDSDTPYYPLHPALQDTAESLVTFNNTFTGSSSGDFSISVRGAIEYKITKHWNIGASFYLQRGEFYKPDNIMIYLKYFFNNNYDSVPLPPAPPLLYSKF